MSDQAGTAGGGFWADAAGERALDRYSTLVNMVDDGIYQLNAEGRFVAVNDTIVELTGYSREELLGEHASLVLADEDVSRIQHEIDRRFTDDDRRDEPIEFTARTADGDAIPCELELHLLVEGSTLQGSIGVVRDITERKRVERDLRQERDLVEGIVETSPVGIAVVDADGEVTFTNERAEELYGRSRDELSEFSHDDPRWDLVDENGEPLETGEAPFDRVVTQEEAIYDQVLGLRRPSGERVWVSVNGAPQWTDDGELERAVFAFEDITKQRENERKLEKSERRYRTLAEHFPSGAVGVYDHDLRYTLTEGMVLGETLPSADRLEGDRVPELFPEDTVADLEPLFRAAVEDGETDSTTTEFGGRHWRVWATALRDADGDIFAGLSFAQDITEQVEREAELERALDLLERTERIADVGGWEIDVDTMEVFWTDHTFELLEVDSKEEPPLEEALAMYHEDDQPIVEAAVEDALKSGDPLDVEVRVRRATSSEIRWLRLQGVPETIGGDVVSFRGAAQDITERKRREQALEESEAKFRMLAENLDEMVWISDPDTREILYLNPAYEEIWRRDRESLYDDPTTFFDAVHPDDREQVQQAYQAIPDEEFDEEYRIMRPDGEVRWLDVRASHVRSEGRERVVGIAEDVTERNERERALEESERRYRTLVEHFPNGAVGLYDEDLEYTAVGGQLLDPTGIEPEDRIGSSVYDIYPDELVEEIEPHFEAALDGEANAFEVEFHDRHLYAHTLPIRDADDEVFAGMLVVQDVTERREYERQLKTSNERLEQFAYAASHDLQEPLRMVSSYLQLVEGRYADELDEDGQEFIDFAVDGADRMRDMIDGLLKYSRVETQGDPFEPVDLDTILEEVRENLQMRIEETETTITTESLPRVQGDANQLQQVFQNLLSNAIEYSGDEPPQVHISAERNKDEWVVSVRDEGIGIDPDDPDRIFEVFQSLHSLADHSGTGIGLALCERIVERHGGEIWVDSEPADGATFSFTLPAAGDRDE